MADFSNYELADVQGERGVYDLADGLIPEMAEVFGVDIGLDPSTEALGNLVDKIGKSKVLQENIGHVQEVLDTKDNGLEVAADWVDRSGVQKQLNRSLWIPGLVTPDPVDAIVITGAVANWQDRTAGTLERWALSRLEDPKVYIPVGNRVMNTPTEQTNPNIALFQGNHDGEYPTEAQYAEEEIAFRLTSKGFGVEVLPYETSNGDDIAAAFVAERPEIFGEGKTVVFARVANAGIQLAVQFRKAARHQNIQFDPGHTRPQAFVLTDQFPVARTDEESKNPKDFQNPMTAIRQVAVTAKMLHEAAS
ncbi:MAG TPA: hypothetical protein VJC09_00740 [Candidatus Saccharimonadales bacterium]|nr:hypothetical protein [Candidatus Saccharimonadales bacterium]